jgi:MSHA pilin protein MshD
MRIVNPAVDLCRRAGGFTLVELVVTMVVIGIAMLGIAFALSFAFARQSDALWQVRTVALAEAYAEEILARRFDEVTPVGGVPPCSPSAMACGPAGDDGELRAEFDDVDDYHELDEQPPLDADGNPRAGYDRYRVQVSVAYLDAGQLAAFGLDHVSDGKLITVRVTPPGQAAIEFPVVRGNF